MPETPTVQEAEGTVANPEAWRVEFLTGTPRFLTNGLAWCSGECPTLQLPTDNHVAVSINAMDLKDRLRDIEPTSMALPCRWRRSR